MAEDTTSNNEYHNGSQSDDSDEEQDQSVETVLNEENYIFVVALDFGTTYSGYAFSTRDQFYNNPLDIQSNQEWVAGGTSLVSLKTSTSLLTDKDGNFVAFGYEAEDRFYAELAKDQSEDFMLFRRFKMKLHNKKGINDKLMLEDVTGKKYPAKEIFTLSIKALVDHFKEHLTRKMEIKLSDQDLRWVLTVPAIWGDAAKNYMRQCATQAGIPNEMLKIALEPEAASIYCQFLPIEKNPEGFGMTKEGTRYMVVDIGDQVSMAEETPSNNPDNSGSDDYDGKDQSSGSTLNDQNYLFVVALDFGTTYSSYAFSSRDQFQQNPLDIQSDHGWFAGGIPLISLKTPTSLLIDKDGEYVAFGYEAEDRYYSELAKDQRENYMLFRRFKMKLHNKKGIDENLVMEDVAGKKHQAKQIFTLSINMVLADHFKERVKIQKLNIELLDKDVRWVLTVPAIWNDAAKQYMQQCAVGAGIPDSMLKVALEPEAASIYCQFLPIERNLGGFGMTKKGKDT